MYRLHEGMLVPRHDEQIARRGQGIKTALAGLHLFLPEDKRRVCVEAGGNWGLWPLRLADLFETVYTFEPDHVCFTCLTYNCRDKPNVVCLQAGLGSCHKLIDLERDTDTTGNQHAKAGGIYPTLCIDDLFLPVCDLIYLDIEGMELDAILGAAGTIDRCQPIVIFEATKKYDPQERTRTYMERYGYHFWGSIGRDVVMGPEPPPEGDHVGYRWNETGDTLIEERL